MRKQSIFVIAVTAALFTVSVVRAGSLFTIPDDAELAAAGSAKLPAASAERDKSSDAAGRLKEMLNRYRPADFDPDAKAAELEPGVEPALRYVRDHVRYESYAGAFRGAEGAYRSRAGNAADRSLLLARLLKARGIQTRFVMGTLPPDKARILLEQIFAPIQPNSLPPAPPMDDNELGRRIRARAARDYAAVRVALGAKLPIVGGIDHDALLREISAHVWVQAKVGENWVDLDSAFPDATPGKVYASDARPVDALPESMFQRIMMRVIVERLEAGSLKSDTLLELQRPVTDLLEKQVFLLHGVPGGAGGVEGLGGGQAQGVAPILWIDGQANPGKPIHFDDSAAPGGGRGNGALGGFGGFSGALGGGGAPPRATSQFVAEYIEFELNVPGGDRQTFRRTLIDRGGAAWRRALPLDPKSLQKLEKDEHGPLAAQVIHNVCFSGGPHDLASFARAMQVLTPVQRGAGGADAKGSNAPPDPSLQLWLMAMKNLACLVPTDHWFLPALQDDPSARFYLDSPRILIFSLGSRHDGANRISVESEIDWRRDRVRGVARDPSAAAAEVKGKIWYGLLEGALEHELAVETGSNPDGVGQPSISSTSASLGNEGLTVISAAEAGDAWTSLARNRETAARISLALKSGDLLVVPKAVLSGEGESAWWAVSAANADTRAVWGADINATISNSPWTPPPDNTGGIYQVNPDGTSIDLKNPSRSKKGAGNEYGTITFEVSIKSLLIASGLSVVIVYSLYVAVRAIFF